MTGPDRLWCFAWPAAEWPLRMPPRPDSRRTAWRDPDSARCRFRRRPIALDSTRFARVARTGRQSFPRIEQGPDSRRTWEKRRPPPNARTETVCGSVGLVGRAWGRGRLPCAAPRHCRRLARLGWPKARRAVALIGLSRSTEMASGRPALPGDWAEAGWSVSGRWSWPRSVRKPRRAASHARWVIVERPGYCFERRPVRCFVLVLGPWRGSPRTSACVATWPAWVPPRCGQLDRYAWPV